MDTEKCVQGVYEMVFPYGFYNGEPGQTCLVIERELKTLCKNNQRHVLSILGRYLDLGFDATVSTSVICGQIQDKLREICFSLSDLDKSKYIIGLKTGLGGVVEKDSPLSSNDRIICRKMSVLKGAILYTLFTDQNAAGYMYMTGNAYRLPLPTDPSQQSVNYLRDHGLYIDLDESTHILKIKTFKNLWNDLNKKDYIFYPPLRVAGTYDKFSNKYMILSPNFTLNHNNYLTDKAVAYNEDISRPVPMVGKNPLELFKMDMEEISNIDNKIEYIAARDSLSDTSKNFLRRLYDMILDGKIDLVKEDPTGEQKYVFTTLDDIC